MRRQASKRQRAKMKADRRERRRRNDNVTRLYGPKGHRACGRKRRYATRDEADVVRLESMRKGNDSLRSYRCPYCGGWHLSHCR